VNDFRNNHYVPRWYQDRFIPQSAGPRKFYYLDKYPEVRKSGGRTYRRSNLLRWGPASCFVQRDLYTTFPSSLKLTEIEQYFFGPIDAGAIGAVDYFASFRHPSVDGDAMNALLRFMVLQKLRTPKGLKALAEMVGARNHAQTLIAMQRLQQVYSATWTECIWSIADASQSATKFIVSDHPVTVYNPSCFPESAECRGHRDPNVLYSGTHILFPLSIEKILILTHRSWIRNPYGKPTELRPNPVLYRDAMFNFQDLQTGRMLSEAEVREINYIAKTRAYRYVAAWEEDWLYPERYLRHTHWDRLGGGYLLFPDPRSVPFTVGTMMGLEGGGSVAWDAYGRHPGQPGYIGHGSGPGPEWATAEAFKGEFARVFGPKRRGTGFGLGLRPQSDTDSAELHASHIRAELSGKPRRKWIDRKSKDIQ
jgi:hypothetical protein